MLRRTVPTLDAYARPLTSLRLSVTDRCNLRCRYCMPQGQVAWLPRSEVLGFDEIARAVDVLTALGVTRVRLTGGEPLVRRDLPTLVELLARRPELADLALTTNGVLLAAAAVPLRRAGLGRITVSLDTIDRERFAAITGSDSLERVLAGIDAALAAGLQPVKLDTVVMRGTNDHEIGALLEFAWRRGVEPRLIEYMPVGGHAQWSPAEVLGAAQILEAVTERFGPVRPVARRGAAPAQQYECEDGRRFGLIAANSAPFCSSCDRVRLTANGMLYRCLHSRSAFDLKTPLRAAVARHELEADVASWWARRRNRGAEEQARADGGEPPMHLLGG